MAAVIVVVVLFLKEIVIINSVRETGEKKNISVNRLVNDTSEPQGVVRSLQGRACDYCLPILAVSLIYFLK